MTWPQYRDTSHRLSQLFQVEGIPSYFTIDSDGILTSEMLGGGFDIEGKLKKLVAKAKTAELSAKLYNRRQQGAQLRGAQPWTKGESS